MAETKIITPSSPPSNKHRRNKLVVTGGVGGIAGVLIIGGVIGIVSLLRNRAAKKQREKTQIDSSSPIQDEIKVSKVEEDDNGRQVRASLAPITEEQPEILNMEKQIFNDTTTYQDDDKKIESESVESNPKSLWTSDIIEIIKDGDGGANGDYVPLAKTNEIASIIIGDDDLQGKETEMPGIISEESSPLPLENDIHFVYEDDEEESEETETEREGSEGTGDSSIESNSEAIWPAESIELLTKDGGLIKETSKEPENKIEKGNDYQPLNHPISAEGFENSLQSLNHPISAKEFISRPSFFVWVVLALALLYHFFAHYLPVVLSSE
ncbi:hypothetical protein ACHQM5_015268 [Ranunculus cassubicifolius]